MSYWRETYYKTRQIKPLTTGTTIFSEKTFQCGFGFQKEPDWNQITSNLSADELSFKYILSNCVSSSNSGAYAWANNWKKSYNTINVDRERPIYFFHKTWEFSHFGTSAENGTLLISRRHLLAWVAVVCIPTMRFSNLGKSEKNEMDNISCSIMACVLR